MIDVSIPVLFPVMEDDCKSYYDVDWFCVADEDYIFDKLKLQLYNEFNRTPTSDFVVAIEGKEYQFFKSSNFHNLIMDKAVIFARFTPDNKKDLVEQFSENGFVTLFCGDGANDTGALSSADVGVSLATNEATLAASFNSLSLNSVLDVIKEGRSALAFSCSQFKYILYSQILIGFGMSVLLYQLYYPSNSMSLINDLISCYILGYALIKFKASTKLHYKKMEILLTSESLSIFFEMLATVPIFFIFSLWICPGKLDITSDLTNTLGTAHVTLKSKNSAVIFVSTILLIVYRSFKFANFGLFRQSRFSNYNFLLIFAFCLLFSICLVVSIFLKSQWIMSKLEIEPLNGSDNFKTLGCFALSFLITVVFDFCSEKKTHVAENKADKDSY